MNLTKQKSHNATSLSVSILIPMLVLIACAGSSFAQSTFAIDLRSSQGKRIHDATFIVDGDTLTCDSTGDFIYQLPENFVAGVGGSPVKGYDVEISHPEFNSVVYVKGDLRAKYYLFRDGETGYYRQGRMVPCEVYPDRVLVRLMKIDSSGRIRTLTELEESLAHVLKDNSLEIEEAYGKSFDVLPDVMLPVYQPSEAKVIEDSINKSLGYNAANSQSKQYGVFILRRSKSKDFEKQNLEAINRIRHENEVISCGILIRDYSGKYDSVTTYSGWVGIRIKESASKDEIAELLKSPFLIQIGKRSEGRAARGIYYRQMTSMSIEQTNTFIQKLNENDIVDQIHIGYDRVLFVL
jgi:hypothetical protein